MFKRNWWLGAVAVAAVLVIGSVATAAYPGSVEAAGGGRWGGARGQGVVPPVVTPVAPLAPAAPVAPAPGVAGTYDAALSGSEVEALKLALDDEYKARTIYSRVIADLGAARPFTQIVRAEDSHIAALVNLFNRYGLAVPVNPYPGSVPTFDTLGAACAAGVQAEIDNAAVYDKIFSMVDNPDIIRVFTSLQQASLTKHLPAFERCAL